MQIDVTIGLMVLIIIASLRAWKDSHLYQKFIFSTREIKENNEWYRFITSGFIHADYMHLGFNCFALLIFGQPLLAEMSQAYLYGMWGNIAFLGLFLLGVIVSSIPNYWKYQDGYYRSLGASGGVSSIVFAYVLLYPTSKLGLILIPFFEIPAFIFAAFYLIYSYQKAKMNNDNIGHTAHFVGSVFGWVFMLAFHPFLILDFWDQVKNYLVFLT